MTMGPPRLPPRRAGSRLLLACLLLPWAVLPAILAAMWLGVDLAGFLKEMGPPCIFHKLTGLDCPGCGGTRATIALLHGDIAGGLRYNLFWIPCLIVLLVEYIRGWRRYWGIPSRSGRWHARFCMVFIWLTILWTVGRNIVGL